ncbi:MAG: AbiH family protein [Flavobacteriaceae bacterium]|nr:hypothetical protein [Flavobacteriaceae bacterium]
MNKIIIIGNGFDLAHGLKTSYKDLMEFIIEDANPIGIKEGNCGVKHYPNSNFIAFKQKPRQLGNTEYEFTSCPKHSSIFFKELFNHYNKYEKWIDLESLYYRLLRKNLSLPENIDILNREFDHLKNLLQKYLKEKVENPLPDFNRDFRDCIFENTEIDEKILGIINFNYTKKTVAYHLQFAKYKSNFYHENFQLINIHGDLNNSLNPIIFGYGDDNSEEYNKIQNLEKDYLLKNFKTFQYLQTSNYHRLLSLLEVEKNINIEIIGHSCGLTDKTLLKTIFQHPNIKKIEYRYHGGEQNYFNNIYNISRIFDDNVLMRKKLINLTLTRKVPRYNLL